MDAQQFLAEAKALEEKIIADRRYLHAYPGSNKGNAQGYKNGLNN